MTNIYRQPYVRPVEGVRLNGQGLHVNTVTGQVITGRGGYDVSYGAPERLHGASDVNQVLSSEVAATLGMMAAASQDTETVRNPRAANVSAQFLGRVNAGDTGGARGVCRDNLGYIPVQVNAATDKLATGKPGQLGRLREFGQRTLPDLL